MSLDTVLKIGNIYRKSNIGLEQHRYINSVWKDIEALKKNKNEKGSSIETTVYALPVRETEEEFVFDFDKLYQIHDHDKWKALKYLNFKTSDKDAEKKYLFGDILYSRFTDKKGVEKENGNYRMEKLNKSTVKPSSFGRAKEEAKSLQNTLIGKFRVTFEKHLTEIEEILQKHEAVVLHFAFSNENQWFELPHTLDLINKKLIQEFVSEHPETKRVVLDKFLFKTIGGTKPDFKSENEYKIKAFNNTDEVVDLMYAVSISEKPLINVRDFGIVVLPNGDNLTAEVLDRFFQKKGLADVTEAEENLINKENQNKDSQNEDFDAMFSVLLDNEFSERVKYDIVFIKPAGLSSPSVDMVEISNIEKSKLREIHDKIVNIKNDLRLQSNKLLNKSKLQPKYDIRNSFFEVLGAKGKTQKKYSFHLLKVLPQIYTDAYYNDPILLPTFIEKVERNIRDDFSNFNILKFDFYFLMKIQKNDNMTEIENSKNYRLGRQLGIIAKPVAYAINSFEKSYVGNLTRKIASPKELEEFAAFMMEKLSIHGKMYPSQRQAYEEFMTILKESSTEKYDKYRCALGFFESFYAPKKEEDNSTIVNP